MVFLEYYYVDFSRLFNFMSKQCILSQMRSGSGFKRITDVLTVALMALTLLLTLASFLMFFFVLLMLHPVLETVLHNVCH